MFGSRLEKLSAVVADQLALDLADLTTGVTLPIAANDDHVPSKPAGATSKPRKKVQRNIGALPKHLPRCEQIIEPETTAFPCCQGRLHKIGQDVSEVLDVIPAILRVLPMIRPKYGCRGCEGAVVQAKASPRLIENSMASTALVTHVVVSKLAWFSTLYRQVQILAGHGVHLDGSTVVGWVKRTAWWLRGSMSSSCGLSTLRHCSFATRPRCRSWIPEGAAPKSASSGLMRWTTDRGEDRRHPLWLTYLRTAAARLRSPPQNFGLAPGPRSIVGVAISSAIREPHRDGALPPICSSQSQSSPKQSAPCVQPSIVAGAAAR